MTIFKLLGVSCLTVLLSVGCRGVKPSSDLDSQRNAYQSPKGISGDAFNLTAAHTRDGLMFFVEFASHKKTKVTALKSRMGRPNRFSDLSNDHFFVWNSRNESDGKFFEELLKPTGFKMTDSQKSEIERLRRNASQYLFGRDLIVLQPGTLQVLINLLAHNFNQKGGGQDTIPINLDDLNIQTQTWKTWKRDLPGDIQSGELYD